LSFVAEHLGGLEHQTRGSSRPGSALSAAPHSLQNFAPSAFSCPETEQTTMRGL
jgi:hypothetical protein